MIRKALLAATVASGFIVPAVAGVYLPPKPAIVKPENIEFSKHLLAMPFTFGMLPGKGATAAPRSLTYRTGQAFTTAATTQTITSAAIGTAASDRLVVVTVCWNGGTTLSGVTAAGTAMNLVVSTTSISNKSAIYGLVVTSGTTANIVATFSSNQRCTITVYTVLLGTTSATASDTQTATASAVTSVSLPSITVPSGGVYIACCAIQSNAGSATWTGATENYDVAYQAATGGSSASGNTTGSVSVSVSGPTGSIWGACIATW